MVVVGWRRDTMGDRALYLRVVVDRFSLALSATALPLLLLLVLLVLLALVALLLLRSPAAPRVVRCVCGDAGLARLPALRSSRRCRLGVARGLLAGTCWCSVRRRDTCGDCGVGDLAGALRGVVPVAVVAGEAAPRRALGLVAFGEDGLDDREDGLLLRGERVRGDEDVLERCMAGTRFEVGEARGSIFVPELEAAFATVVVFVLVIVVVVVAVVVAFFSAVAVVADCSFCP